jgi:hypothetical protein
LQAVIGDNALDGADADGVVGLAQLLRDDLGRSIRVQEQVAQDPTHGFIGPAIVGSGAGFLGLKSRKAALLEGVEQLIVALAAVAVLLGDGGDVLLEALAFQEHEKPASQRVFRGNGQSAGRAGELVGSRVEMKDSLHPWRIAQGGVYV